MTDPIADMFTRIRNAQSSKRDSVLIPRSNFKVKIAEILVNEKYAESFRDVEKDSKLHIKLMLSYVNGNPMISHIERVSKPGQRIYSPCQKMGRALGGDGIVIVSTSRGLMTSKQAKKANIGGEIIGKIW